MILWKFCCMDEFVLVTYSIYFFSRFLPSNLHLLNHKCTLKQLKPRIKQYGGHFEFFQNGGNHMSQFVYTADTPIKNLNVGQFCHEFRRN